MFTRPPVYQTLVWIYDPQRKELPERLLLLLLLLNEIEFSLGGSRPYTSTDKTNNIHKRNNTET